MLHVWIRKTDKINGSAQENLIDWITPVRFAVFQVFPPVDRRLRFGMSFAIPIKSPESFQRRLI